MRDRSFSLRRPMKNSNTLEAHEGTLRKCVALWRMGVDFWMQRSIRRMSASDHRLTWPINSPDSSLTYV